MGVLWRRLLPGVLSIPGKSAIIEYTAVCFTFFLVDPQFLAVTQTSARRKAYIEAGAHQDDLRLSSDVIQIFHVSNNAEHLNSTMGNGAKSKRLKVRLSVSYLVFPKAKLFSLFHRELTSGEGM